MSQPPSLPQLSAFLRPGHQRTETTGGSASSTGDARGVEKRRLDNAPVHGLEQRAPQNQLHARMFDEDASTQQPHRQKRRANLFVQYGEEFNGPSHHRPQHEASSVVYDLRHPPQQSSPHRRAFTPQASHHRAPVSLPPPPTHQRHSSQTFSEYSGGYDRNSGDSSGPQGLCHAEMDARASRDAQRVVPVKTEPLAAAQEPVQRERKSRYLSESDRRSIIMRIDNGEKQVALAKEYQVSRAAICNLYKNRKEVLTRADRDPKAKHPKRLKEKEAVMQTSEPAVESTAEDKDTSEGQPGDDDPMSDEHSSSESIDVEPPRVPAEVDPSHTVEQQRYTAAQPVRQYNASAASYPIRRMVSLLRTPQIPQATFRRVAERLVRSLLEEVVACLPSSEITTVTPVGDSCASVLPLDDDSVCAVSMEDRGTLMLQAFLGIFPSALTSILSLSTSVDQTADKWVARSHRLPRLGAATSVVLLTTECATGSRVCASLTHLVSIERINPASIFVASVISARPGLSRVHQQFPGVTIVSAAVDEAVDERGQIRPGIGDLMERYWQQEVNNAFR